MVLETIALMMGEIVLLVGGGILAVAIIGFLGWLASAAWVAFSEVFRPICKAESMIFEYRKYRHEFMCWKALNEDAEDGK